MLTSRSVYRSPDGTDEHPLVLPLITAERTKTDGSDLDDHRLGGAGLGGGGDPDDQRLSRSLSKIEATPHRGVVLGRI